MYMQTYFILLSLKHTEDFSGNTLPNHYIFIFRMKLFLVGNITFFPKERRPELKGYVVFNKSVPLKKYLLRTGLPWFVNVNLKIRDLVSI